MSNLLRPRSLARALPLLLAAATFLFAGCIVRVGPPVAAPATPSGSNEVVPLDKDAGKGKEDPKSSPTTPPPPPPPPVALSTGKRFALLVGVKDYDSKDLPDLSFPEQDVDDLADTLIADGYADENIIRMTNGRAAKDGRLRPTSANIREQLDQLLGRCGKDDVVLVGLTGHGIQCKDHKQFFCGYQAVLAEAEDDRQEPKTLIAIEEVYQKLGSCPAGLKLLVVDACRNDPFAKGGGRKEVDDLKSVTLGPLQAGVIALYSCSEGEHSYEAPELQHGVFFNYLIKGLKGDADMHQDGRITWTELADYLVSNVDRYTTSRLRLRQRPHFKGESNADEPLAIRPAGHSTPSDPAPEPGLLLSEDFLNVPQGGPPKGWNGDAFSVVKDKSGRACLEVNKNEGMHFLELPRKALSGDFYVEVEVLLDGRAGQSDQHQMKLELEGRGGAVSVPVSVLSDGNVAIGNGGQWRKAQNYAPYAAITRVRLTREGKNYTVALNGETAMGTPMDYTGDFDVVRIGLPAGLCRDWRTLGATAKIYSIKVGQVKGDGRHGDDPVDRLLLNEDFKQTPPGGPPKGWEGDAFSVVPDKNSRACLEVNKSAGFFYLTLPRMALTGDFYIDAEVLLDGRVGQSDQHQMKLVLEGRGGAVRLPIWVNSDGGVLVGNDGQMRKPPNYSPYQITRLRLAREKNVFQVSLNGEVATGTPLDNTLDFDAVRIGLPAGLCRDWRTLSTTAKIYSVRVGLPGPGPTPVPPPLPAGIREDFAKAAIGALPDGWGAGPRRNLSVQKSGDQNALELTSPANGPDAVTLPNEDLKGNFYIEFEAEYPSEDTTVALQLAGGAKVIPLVLTLDGHGTLSAIGKQAPGFQGKGKRNVLGLERSAKGYVIKLNEEQVAAPPLAAAPGPFDTVRLIVGVKDKDQNSPRITSVRVQPLGP